VIYRTVSVKEQDVFYRESGDRRNPTLLLLHGFPTSSFMFRELMPLLADRYHVIAPDLPGFGFSAAPDRSRFKYTFENLAKVIEGFVDAVGLGQFAIYLFDYGAPVGLRLALARPDRITALVSQNGNAYEEGLGSAWDPIRRYWVEPTDKNRSALRDFLRPQSIRQQYLYGATAARVAPESYTLDAALLDSDEKKEIQLDLLLDYASNVALYPKFQEFFRTKRLPFLAIWGEDDPFFIPAGAEAYRRDIPDAEIRFLDTGHFALETHAQEIATALRTFLGGALSRIQAA
jgi:pimeloyl-ACP methyl ester carboxylesterase